MAILDKLLGTLLVGTYANSILYTLEVVAVIQYSKSNWDTSPLRAMVYFTLVVDTVSTMSSYAAVYLHTITHWGDDNYLSGRHWISTVSLIAHGITTTIVLCFLTYRYWKLSQNKYVTYVLVLLVFAALGGCVWTVVSLLVYTATTQRDLDKILLVAMVWFGTNLSADVAVCLALLWQLRQTKSPFKATQNLIHRLIASTIRTGALISVFAGIGLILFLSDKRSNAAGGFGIFHARIYSLTMLYTLNNRSSLRQGPANPSDTQRLELLDCWKNALDSSAPSAVQGKASV